MLCPRQEERDELEAFEKKPQRRQPNSKKQKKKAHKRLGAAAATAEPITNEKEKEKEEGRDRCSWGHYTIKRSKAKNAKVNAAEGGKVWYLRSIKLVACSRGRRRLLKAKQSLGQPSR